MRNRTPEYSTHLFWHFSDGLTVDFYWLIGEDPYYW